MIPKSEYYVPKKPPAKPAIGRYTQPGDIGPMFDPRHGTSGSTPGAGTIADEAYLNQLIQARLDEEFGAEAKAAAMAGLPQGGAGGGEVSRVTAMYNAAREKTHAQAKDARTGSDLSWAQYQQGKAASDALLAPGVGVPAAPASPPAAESSVPEVAAAQAEGQKAMDSLAAQRAQSYDAAANIARFGSAVNVNSTEQELIGQLDAEGATALADAQSKDSQAASANSQARGAAEAEWNANRKARELEIRDEIYKNNGIDPYTKQPIDATKAENTDKMNPDEQLGVMQNAYTKWMNDNGKSGDWGTSRAGKVYTAITNYASQSDNERGQKANANAYYDALFNYNPDDKEAWKKNLMEKVGEDPNDKDAQTAAEEMWNTVYGSGGVLNGSVVRDWIDAGIFGQKPLGRPNRAPGRAPRKVSGGTGRTTTTTR